MGKVKKKRKIKKQLIFNCISIIAILIFGCYYLSRFIHYKIENDKEIVYSDVLAEQIVERVNKYDIKQSLVLTNDIYRFVDDANDNYVKFMGFTWRIIRINADKSITMISEDSISSLAHGNITSFTDSQVNKWLNKIDNEEHTGIFYNMISENKEFLTNTKTCLDTFNTVEAIGCYETNNDYSISLLSIKDYASAGGAGSYLNNGTYFWTTNQNKENKFWYISDDGKTGVADTDLEYGIRPVITLAPGIKTLGGVGTSDDPYIIKEHKPTKLNDAYIGEYITLNDSLWRIVDKDDTSIKVVSEDYITNEDSTTFEISYSDVNNLSNLNDKTSLLYYLNKTYYKNFKEKDLLVKGNFYNGTYNVNGNYDYKTTYNSSITTYVGLLSIAEPFVYDFGNIFTMTRNVDNELSIFIINEDKLLFEDAINSMHYVRPAVYVKNDATIIEGEGTYLSPYILGSETNEN